MPANLLVQYQASGRSEELLPNANLASWTGGTPDDWNVTVNGSSTVTEETAILRPGTSDGSAARLTYDATPGLARINQTITALAEVWVYFKFWYICEVFSSSQSCGILIVDSGVNVFLQDDGKTWSPIANTIPIPSSDVWTYFELKFLLHQDYSNYFVGFGNGNTITNSYIIIDDIQFKLDTTFVATQNTTFNGAQYLAGLSADEISISQNAAYKGKFEQSGFSMKVQSNIPGSSNPRGNIGRSAIARRGDGSKIGTYKITDITKYISEPEYQLTDGFGELSNNVNNLEITEGAFPDAPESSTGTTINRFSGQFLVDNAADAGKKNYLKAHRTKGRVISTSDGVYVIGLSIQNISSLQYVTTPDDTDVTSSCTLVYPTSSDPYHYVLYDKVKADEEYLKINFTYPAISAGGVIEEIGELLFSDYPFNMGDIATLLIGRNYNKLTGGLQDSTDPRFLLDKQRKYTEILENICQTYNFSYYVNGDSEIVFEASRYEDLLNSSRTKVLNDDLAANFTSSGYKEPYLELTNQLSTEWGYDGGGSNQKNIIFDLRESQRRNDTIRNDSIELPLFPVNANLSRRMGDCTSRLWMLDKFYSQREIAFKIESISDEIEQGVTIDDVLIPMYIFAFRHVAFGDDELHYLQIRRISRTYPKNYATVDFIDVTDIIDIDTNTSLLIQSNNDSGSLVFFDQAPNGFHTIRNSNKGAKHDNGFPLFLTTTITRNTTTPSLLIGQGGFYSDLHILAALAANDIISAELSCWLRFNNTGNNEFIIAQYVDANNLWGLRKTTTDKMAISAIDTGTTVLNLVSTSTVADGKWHHVVFFRDDGDNVGLYVDGQQEAYVNVSLNTIFAILFTALNNGNSAFYFDGDMQDLAIALNTTARDDRGTGWFNLAPNSGLTDKYEVPWGVRSRFWRQYWVNR